MSYALGIFHLRCPDAATASTVSISMTTIVDDQEFVFILMGILKIVQFGLQCSRRILTWNVPLFGCKSKLFFEDALQDSKFL